MSKTMQDMVELYRVFGNKYYLKFSRHIDRCNASLIRGEEDGYNIARICYMKSEVRYHCRPQNEQRLTIEMDASHLGGLSSTNRFMVRWWCVAIWICSSFSCFSIIIINELWRWYLYVYVRISRKFWSMLRRGEVRTCWWAGYLFYLWPGLWRRFLHLRRCNFEEANQIQ